MRLRQLWPRARAGRCRASTAEMQQTKTRKAKKIPEVAKEKRKHGRKTLRSDLHLSAGHAGAGGRQIDCNAPACRGRKAGQARENRKVGHAPAPVSRETVARRFFCVPPVAFEPRRNSQGARAPLAGF